MHCLYTVGLAITCARIGKGACTIAGSLTLSPWSEMVNATVSAFGGIPPHVAFGSIKWGDVYKVGLDVSILTSYFISDGTPKD